jgi:hypothetical protein
LAQFSKALKNSRSALAAFERRWRSRLGTPKAITATAHQLARLFYSLSTQAEASVDPGVDDYERKYQQRVVHHLLKKAHSLGFALIPQSASSSVTDSVS